LTELANKNNQNLISNFFFSASNLIISHRENKEKFSLDLEALLKQSSSEDLLRFQKKITCLQKKNLSIYQEKGYKSLFLGVIFLRGYFYNSKNVLRLVSAPLFLLPCDLEKIKNLNLVFKSEKKLNHSLLYYLQKELGLAKDKFTNFLNALEKNNEEINTLENYLLFLNNEFQKLVSTSHIKIKFSPTLSSFLEEKEVSKIKENEPIPNPFTETSLTIIKNNTDKNFYAEPFVKFTLLNKPKNYPENQLEIVLNFCLTIDSEPNLSLFRDFEEIIDEYSQDKIINWTKSALNLLRGEMEGVIAHPEKKETTHQPNSLYTPFPSDPSQTRILRAIFQDFSENALCIDGPPGTGKSQLICNLLTNSLFYQKKVLVICEKEVALKVIYDKLSSLGLNHSIIKINELAQTPQIYREILNNLENEQKENANQEISDITSQIVSLEEKLAANFKKIEKYCEIEKEFQINYQISLQEVYIRFERKTQLTPAIVKLNN
jgi:Cdc6-like AAA superfamily ATPase